MVHDLYTAARAVPLCDLKCNYISSALQIQQVKLTVKLAYTSTKVAICKHTLPYVHAQLAWLASSQGSVIK